MGLPKQLQLQGNDFSNAATAFFIAYLIAEIPNGEPSLLGASVRTRQVRLTERLRIHPE